ncbi:beta-ketoacyl-[acyl-carrier-protein] synthase family protein [Streptomyces candidus]|uniref:3-oxoacyl-[acyl-carrier-protein] synthase II n=1 Tax=Streptomyces candidus TaxID=67283 RepID=A0A7X0LQ84_9ACTN|nr:beta-ketoacyl-[acyl-carrier-protein] synthase family protein [Streptomyces candidus]MBB6436770.1 3-oxoacyl-[acyl-carrier-protein] synthase II [Streptomyces candidus]GHH51337.1 3-oxoacyl-ACP synthase [Streptomyces candidus]
MTSSSEGTPPAGSRPRRPDTSHPPSPLPSRPPRRPGGGPSDSRPSYPPGPPPVNSPASVPGGSPRALRRRPPRFSAGSSPTFPAGRPEPRRVVVTGLGALSSIGTGTADFTAGLRAGRSGVSPITAFDTAGFAHANGCQVPDFDPHRLLRRIDPAEYGRAAQFSAAAARMAVVDAGLSPGDLRRVRCQISVGTTDGESYDLDRITETHLHRGPSAVTAQAARRIPAARLGIAVARELGLADVEILTIGTACSAGNYSIGNGLDAIRQGDADFALCGGADAFCRKTFAAFYRLGTIAPDCCRPFDTRRQGILTGEGAGLLLLESLDSALARGARIYAEVLGYGLNCDAHHPVAPEEESVARCLQLALDDAGVKHEEVDLISAHGTGTRANDVTESRAVRRVYGDSPPRTISLKSMLGHTMGAASALGAIACSLAITHGFIPPTINHRTTDPECAVDCVPNQAVDADLRIVQNNGLAFGGNNAAVVLGRYEGREL